MKLILRGRSTVRTVDSNSTNEGSNPYPAARHTEDEGGNRLTARAAVRFEPPCNGRSKL